jgi:hypothetical protein
METVDFYCYYKIDSGKLDNFRSLAKKITELYIKNSECKSYRFSIGIDPGRQNTAMENGQFVDVDTFHKLKEHIETGNSEIFAALDAVIQGGLKARKYEFFSSLE